MNKIYFHHHIKRQRLTPTRQGGRRSAGYKTLDSRFAKTDSLFLGQTYLFRLHCVEQII